MFFFGFLMVCFLFMGFFGNMIFGLYFDYLTLLFIMLSLMIFYFVFNFISFKHSIYLIFNFLLLILILLFFFQDNFMYLYIFLELAVLPISLIMLIWGSNPERLKAFLFFLFYALLGGFPFLLVLLDLYYNFSTLNYKLLGYSSLVYFNNLDFLFVGLFILGFLMKMPLWSLHYWLPLAHVEAPVGGSMSLAAIMLKMGSYSLIRLWSMGLKFSFCWLFFWSFLGVLLVSLFIYRLFDYKSIMAYSSVMHMTLSMFFFYFLDYLSLLGFLLLLVSHGFISSFLFYYGGYMYKVSGSRSMMMKKGFGFYCFSIYFFLVFVLFNMSFPPFSSFFSEFILFSNVFSYCLLGGFCLLGVFFFVGLYKMYLYVLLSHGKSFMNYSYNNSLEVIKFLGCFFHFIFYIFCLLFFFV